MTHLFIIYLLRICSDLGQRKWRENIISLLFLPLYLCSIKWITPSNLTLFRDCSDLGQLKWRENWLKQLSCQFKWQINYFLIGLKWDIFKSTPVFGQMVCIHFQAIQGHFLESVSCTCRFYNGSRVSTVLAATYLQIMRSSLICLYVFLKISSFKQYVSRI